MAFAAQMIVSPPDRRGTARRPLETPATLRDATRGPRDIVVHDLSVTGCLIETDVPLDLGARVRIGIAGAGASDAIVVREDPRGYGCQFEVSLSEERVEFAGRINTVHVQSFAELPVHDDGEPYVSAVPFAYRTALMIGLSGLLWTVIAAPFVMRFA